MKLIQTYVESCSKCPFKAVDPELGAIFCSNKELVGDSTILIRDVGLILPNCPLSDVDSRPVLKIGSGNSNIKINVGGR